MENFDINNPILPGLFTPPMFPDITQGMQPVVAPAETANNTTPQYGPLAGPTWLDAAKSSKALITLDFPDPEPTSAFQYTVTPVSAAEIVRKSDGPAAEAEKTEKLTPPEPKYIPKGIDPRSYASIYEALMKWRKPDYNNVNALYDNPTVKYFKIFFHFGDYGSYATGPSSDNSKAYRDAGLLAPTFLLENAATGNDGSGNYKFSKNNYNIKEYQYHMYNSAWSYLKNNGEEERAALLKYFILLLSDISSNSPWYFQAIEGMDQAIERKQFTERNFMIEENRKKITIKCLSDAVDDRIATLLDLYRSITYSWVTKREILPANMRKFDMSIYVFEAPLGDITRKVNQLTNISGCDFSNWQYEYGWYAKDPWESSITSHGENVEASSPINSNEKYLSYKLFEFRNCEFDYNSAKTGLTALSNVDGVMPVYDIGINFDDCFEHRFNFVHGAELGDMIILDQAQLLITSELAYHTNKSDEKRIKMVNSYNTINNNIRAKNSALAQWASTGQNNWIGDGIATNVDNLIFGNLSDRGISETQRAIMDANNDINGDRGGEISEGRTYMDTEKTGKSLNSLNSENYTKDTFNKYEEREKHSKLNPGSGESYSLRNRGISGTQKSIMNASISNVDKDNGGIIEGTERYYTNTVKKENTLSSLNEKTSGYSEYTIDEFNSSLDRNNIGAAEQAMKNGRRGLTDNDNRFDNQHERSKLYRGKTNIVDDQESKRYYIETNEQKNQKDYQRNLIGSDKNNMGDISKRNIRDRQFNDSLLNKNLRDENTFTPQYVDYSTPRFLKDSGLNYIIGNGELGQGTGEFLDRNIDNAPDLRQSIIDETDYRYDSKFENYQNLKNAGKDFMDIVEEDGIGLKNRYGEFLDRSADNAPDLRQSIMDETDHYYDPILENPENLRDRGKSYLDPTKGIGTGEGLLLDKLSGDRLTSNLGGNLHIKDIPKNLHEEVPTQILEQKAKELEERISITRKANLAADLIANI